MAIQIIRADITCDKCECGIPLPSFIKIQEIRNYARKQGWDCSSSKDYCPGCAHQRRLKQDAPA